ncbi:MAG: methylase protein [Pseudobdellovibrio sp.]|jgi:site-specific DNA-methyltransferase (adenine-specific)|nr:methylase protein [Pseudobdellovibrio sp.]
MLVKAGTVIKADCLKALTAVADNSIDLIYLDPPFFSQREHSLTKRDGSESYRFSDNWQSMAEYINFLKARIALCKIKLKPTGSLFLHCDRSASHYIKVMLDEIFNSENFQSEIIWSYRRWSNSKKGLLSNHQSIFFYSKTADFKFNQIFEDYSPSTNVDQIMQLRVRDERNKTVYRKDNNGDSVLAKEKKGVPLGDVWDIPYLNPKAKERVSYPTQKPVLLLEKIISLVTSPGDIVLDPFCGSGTTLVAAKLLGRKYVGFDISAEAVKLSEERLANPVKSTSKLLEKGRESYRKNNPEVESAVKSIGGVPVQRSKGIDGFLTTKSGMVPFKVVFKLEDLKSSAQLITQSSAKNKFQQKALLAKFQMKNSEVKKVESEFQLIVFTDLKELSEKLRR